MRYVAHTAAKTGMAPLIMPVTLEVVHCWAIGKSSNGTAIQMTPSKATRGQSSRSIGARERVKSASVPAPKATRAMVMTPGAKARSPISMNRNDEPQISAMAASRPQSASV